jgi:hypothetical protein
VPDETRDELAARAAVTGRSLPEYPPDRPRQALVTGYVAAAGAALGMAAAGSLAVLDVAAVGYGIARSVTGPAANALPPRIVGDDELLAANALLGAHRRQALSSALWRRALPWPCPGSRRRSSWMRLVT